MSTRVKTDLIVFHCSATKPSQDIGRAEIEEWHLAKGWTAIGYHFVIRRDGRIELGRPMSDVGAHVQGFNAGSVGICMVGGLRENGDPLIDEYQTSSHDNGFTSAQWISARRLLNFLILVYPDARVTGHRDLSPDANSDGKIQKTEWLKTCPGFDAAQAFGV